MIGENIEVNIAGGLDIKLPKMVHVRQIFQTPKIESVQEEVLVQLEQSNVMEKVKPGMKIAIGVGSGGVANIAECTKTVVEKIKAIGA